MKRSALKRISSDPRKKAIAALDRALSDMIRLGRDLESPCILCGKYKLAYDNGHFIERGRMGTRFHPMNCNKECTGCNNSHVSGYRADKGFPYGMAINRKWGAGVAEFLYELSRPISSWDIKELEQLKSAARIGSAAYRQLYFELRPSHYPALQKAA